jgi:hypothetical protein
METQAGVSFKPGEALTRAKFADLTCEVFGLGSNLPSQSMLAVASFTAPLSLKQIRSQLEACIYFHLQYTDRHGPSHLINL